MNTPDPMRFADAGRSLGRAIAEHHHAVERAVVVLGVSASHPTARVVIRGACARHVRELADAFRAANPEMTAEEWGWMLAAAKRSQAERARELAKLPGP